MDTRHTAARPMVAITVPVTAVGVGVFRAITNQAQAARPSNRDVSPGGLASGAG